MVKGIDCIISGKNLDHKFILWIYQNANAFGLKGITFFKNDGSIKIVAEGEERNLNRFINKVNRGPYFFAFFSPVEVFSVTWHEPKNEFEDFSISETTE